MNRKKWLVLILAAAVVSLAIWGVHAAIQKSSVQPETHNPIPSQPQSRPDSQPEASSRAEENTTPSGAVTALIEAVRSMDAGIAAQWVTSIPEGLATEAYHEMLAPVLSRIEYEVGAEKIVGDTAVVDVTITAVDVSGALGGAGAEAAAYLMSSAINRTPVDWVAFMTKYFSELDANELVRVSRDATVHLVRDSGGKWRVDTSNPENEPFLNALTGGALEAYAKLQKLVG